MASTNRCRTFSRRFLQSTRSQCLYQPICRYSSSAGAQVILEGGTGQQQAEIQVRDEQAKAISSKKAQPAIVIKQQSPYRTSAAMVVSRAPTLTRDLTEFEKAFFFYQKRLDKRLSLPFNQEFYFREGTLAKDEWIRKRSNLETYDPKGPDAWKDELRIGEEPKADEDVSFEALVKNTVTGEEVTEHDTEEEIAAKLALDKPLPRETKADREGNERSLNRKGSRTVYLLVQAKDIDGKDAWMFPQVDLVGTENLGAGSLRALFDSCGINMNLWVVGNAPIGFHTQMYSDAYRKKYPKDTMIGRKVFFMKARILAGQANIKDNSLGAKDFKWLTKEEIEKVVKEEYWIGARHMLATR